MATLKHGNASKALRGFIHNEVEEVKDITFDKLMPKENTPITERIDLVEGVEETPKEENNKFVQYIGKGAITGEGEKEPF